MAPWDQPPQGFQSYSGPVGPMGPQGYQPAKVWGPGDPFYNAPGPGPSTTPGSISYVPPTPPTAEQLAAPAKFGLKTAMDQAHVDDMLNAAFGQQQRQGFGTDILFANANQQQESGYLNQDYALGNRRLNNQQAGLDLQRAALGRQPGYLTALHDLANKGFDIQNQQVGLGRQGAFANAGQARRGLESQLTARGAFTSVGGQQGRFDIAGDLLRQVQGYNLQDQSIGLNRQGEAVRYFENMAQVGDQNKKLDIAASDLGIDRDQLSNELQKGLGRLNLSTATNVSDLLGKINSSNIQEAMGARQVFNQALQNSDYYSRMYKDPNAPTYVRMG